jgi:hypothetical protein
MGRGKISTLVHFPIETFALGLNKGRTGGKGREVRTIIRQSQS